MKLFLGFEMKKVNFWRLFIPQRYERRYEKRLIFMTWFMSKEMVYEERSDL